MIIDLATLDFSKVVADIETIRKYNPQRFEMEQLTAIVHEDRDKLVCVGYKDVTDQEFWIRGHMPGAPLMPGVIQCEAAAQIAGYFTMKHELLGEAHVIGLGGLQNVRFRDPVRVGDRLVLVVRAMKMRRGVMVHCEFQGFVNNRVVVEGEIKGMDLPPDVLSAS